jgi:hypothetical protein
VEREQDRGAPDEIAIAEEQMFPMRSRRRDCDQETGEQREVRGHQPSGDEIEAQAVRDGEARVDPARGDHAGWGEPVADPGRQDVTRWKDPEDLVVEGLSLVELHGCVERPALVHVVEVVVEEEEFESDAHRQQDQEMDRELTIHSGRRG